MQSKAFIAQVVFCFYQVNNWVVPLLLFFSIQEAPYHNCHNFQPLEGLFALPFK